MRLLVLQRLALCACMVLAVGLLRHLAPTRDFSALPGVPALDPWLRGESFDCLLAASERGSDRVFPLYPELVGAFGHVLSVPVAALVVSNLALIAAVFALQALTAPEDAGLARRSLLALLFFPSSFLLSAGNDLALFLACALGTFAAHRARREKLAAFCAAGGVLSHPIGALGLSVPFLVEWLFERRRGGERSAFPRFVLAIPAALLLLAALSRIEIGDALRFPLRALAFTRLTGDSALARLGADMPPIELVTDYGVGLDWAAIALTAAVAVHCSRRQEYAYASFCALALLGHLLLHASPARWFENVNLAFPVFVALGRWCAWPLAGRAYAVAAPMLQVTCAVLFGAGLWAV